MNSLTLVISAPSGAGKTTLINRLLADDNQFGFSISTTTRARRKNEVKDKSYHFVEIAEFQRMIENDEFIEWANVHGNFYGTRKKEIDRIWRLGKIPILDIDVQGAGLLKGKLADAVYIFIVPPTFKILEKRLRHRKTDSDEQIRLRLHNSIQEMQQYDIYDYIVINEKIENALSILEAISSAELNRVSRKSAIIERILEEYNDNPS